MISTPLSFLLVILGLLINHAQSTPFDTLTGKAIGGSDGDIIKILVNKKQFTVRLEGIDAPEPKQSFGNRSKQALSDLVFGKEVLVTKTGQDRYGCSLGFVSTGGIDINAKMIQDGWAWHYKKYNRDSKFADLERQALAVSIGSTRIQTFGTLNHANT
jgi:endonuclease YncB( thermonuclease family)